MTKKTLSQLGQKSLDRLARYKLPKRIQDHISNNLTRYMYILIYRQYGKTELLHNIAMDFLEYDYSKVLPQYTQPNIGVYAPEVSQALKLFYKRFYASIHDNKGYKVSFNKPLSQMNYQRFDGKDCTIQFGGGFMKGEKRARGATHCFGFIDEYGDSPPRMAKSVVAPMLNETGGPLIVTGTPLGPNHYKDEYEFAKKKMESGDKDFFVLNYSIDDALRLGDISQEKYDESFKLYDMNSKEEIAKWRAEYLLDWYAYVPNQIFSREMNNLRAKGHIGYFPHIPGVPVDTFWDVGVNGTAVWFRQEQGGKHFYIDYEEALDDVHLEDFLNKYVFPKTGKYIYRFHIFPMDAGNRREWMTKHPRIEILRKYLQKNGAVCKPSPIIKPDEGIDFTRRHIDRCYFNEDTCEKGIDNLFLYTMNEARTKPDKSNPACHGADAFILSESTSDPFSLSSDKEKYKMPSNIRGELYRNPNQVRRRKFYYGGNY